MSQASFKQDISKKARAIISGTQTIRDSARNELERIAAAERLAAERAEEQLSRLRSQEERAAAYCERRLRAAVKGVGNIRALSDIPELFIIIDSRPYGYFTTGGVFGSELPVDGINYFGVHDDIDYVSVGVFRTGEVMIGSSENAGVIKLRLSDDEPTIREKLAYLAQETSPCNVLGIARDFERRGRVRPLSIAFQVLVEASSDRRMQQYFERTFSFAEGD